ncbi:MAG TPA: hypothetical protein PLO19_03610 [Candidatus Cryosericum sp.]|nr:hypothetical protein [Candidatus Cryosericum sp.]
MITINLLPQARKKRQAQLTHQDKMLIFVIVAVLLVLAGSYAFVRVTAMRETAHLADLNAQIGALGDQQKLLDTNRALAQRSLTMETNLATAVGLQVNTNLVLDDVARDLPKACTLTQAHLTPLSGALELNASSAQFVNLVRFFNALSADKRFSGVHIDSYQVPYTTGPAVQGPQGEATMTLTATWVGGPNE